MADKTRKFRSFKNKKQINRRTVHRGNETHQLFKVYFTQLNLGKRVAAMTNLAQRTSNSHFISFLQEPHVVTSRGQSKITGLDSQHSTYQVNDPHCRAAIYAHRELPMWMNHELSDKDNTSCLWVTKDIGMGRVLLVSSYWDRFVLNPPQKLIQALEYAKTNNFQVLVGADTNAHSTMTGSERTDSRGKFL